MTDVGKAQVHHLLIYESGGLRCVNLSTSLSELNRKFRASTKKSLDGFCRSFLKERARHWDPSKASKCQVLLEGKMFYLVAVEGDRASKVVLLLQKDDMKSPESDTQVSIQRPSASSWGTEVLPLLHRAVVTFLDYGFLILGESPNQYKNSRLDDELLSWQSRKSEASEHPPLPPLPCGVRDFEDAFALFDREGTGLLSQEKFKRGLQVLEVRISKNEREKLFRIIADGKESIDYRHFLRFFTTDGSRESGPMALRAGLARAKSVSHFSSASNNQLKLEPTVTEKRIRGLERVLAILELHTGRWANNIEFNFTRSFILVNRKALSRYRRFVFRRLLSKSQKKRTTECRRPSELSSETDLSSREKKGNDKRLNLVSVPKDRHSISVSAEDVSKLKIRIKELESEVNRKTRKRRNNTIDMGSVNTPIERALQTNLRKLEKEKKDFDKKLRAVQEKGDLRRESLRREIRRLKSEREHLRKELEVVKVKLKSASKASKNQIEEEILWQVRNSVKSNSSKQQDFESELAWKLSSAKNIVEFVGEMRRIMNTRVRRAVKISDELKKSKQKVKKLSMELADIKNSKNSSSKDHVLNNLNIGYDSARSSIETNELKLNETQIYRSAFLGNSPRPLLLMSPSNGAEFLAPLGKGNNRWPEKEKTSPFYSPRAGSMNRKTRLKRNKSEPSLMSTSIAKWYSSRNETEGRKSLISLTPHHVKSQSIGQPLLTLERMERSCSPSLPYSTHSDDYVSNLEIEKDRLKKVAMKARFDLEVSELQRDRYHAQILELRRAIDIYREHKWSEGGSTRREQEVTYLRQRLDKSLVELENKDRQLRYMQSATRETGLGIDLITSPKKGRFQKETLRKILEIHRAFLRLKQDYSNQVQEIRSDLMTFSQSVKINIGRSANLSTKATLKKGMKN